MVGKLSPTKLVPLTIYSTLSHWVVLEEIGAARPSRAQILIILHWGFECLNLLPSLNIFCLPWISFAFLEYILSSLGAEGSLSRLFQKRLIFFCYKNITKWTNLGLQLEADDRCWCLLGDYGCWWWLMIFQKYLQDIWEQSSVGLLFFLVGGWALEAFGIIRNSKWFWELKIKKIFFR